MILYAFNSSTTTHPSLNQGQRKKELEAQNIFLKLQKIVSPTQQNI